MDFLILLRSTWRKIDQSRYTLFEKRRKSLIFEKHIAFFYGLSLCSGIFCYFFSTFWLIGIFLSALLFLHFSHKYWICTVLVLSGFFYAHIHFPSPLLLKSYEGKGQFCIEQIQEKTFGYRKYYSVKGFFRTFQTNNESLKNISCAFSTKKIPELFLGKDLLLTGKLQKKSNVQAKLILDKFSSIQTTGVAYQLSGIRFLIKKTISHFLSKHLNHKKVSAFFDAVLLGNLNDQHLRFAFANIGLQHILVISGFHFAFLTWLFFRLLRKFFSLKFTLYSCLLFITLYFLLIGSAPSIERAWVMSFVFFLGKILGKKTNPINLLGVSLLWEGIFHPIYITHLGFYLSYFACTGIFLYFSKLDQLLGFWIHDRTEEEMRQINCFEKLVLNSLIFFRKSFALSLSVSLFLFPLILYFFHKFSLLSFFFNLIIPPLLFVSFILLFISLILPFAFPICSAFTKGILSLIFTASNRWNYKIISMDFFSYAWLGYFLAFLLLNIFLKKISPKKSPLF